MKGKERRLGRGGLPAPVAGPLSVGWIKGTGGHGLLESHGFLPDAQNYLR